MKEQILILKSQQWLYHHWSAQATFEYGALLSQNLQVNALLLEHVVLLLCHLCSKFCPKAQKHFHACWHVCLLTFHQYVHKKKHALAPFSNCLHIAYKLQTAQRTYSATFTHQCIQYRVLTGCKSL